MSKNNKPRIIEDVLVDVETLPVSVSMRQSRSRSPIKRNRESEEGNSPGTSSAAKRERPGPASSKERRPPSVPAESHAEGNDTESMSEDGSFRGSSAPSAPASRDSSASPTSASRASSRGRPPMTGEYDGIGKMREEKQKIRQEERFREQTRQRLRREAIEQEERDKTGLCPIQPQKRGGTTYVSAAHVDEDASSDEEARKKSPKEAFKRLDLQADNIIQVVKSSKNLKGTCMKKLYGAVELIREEARALRRATTTEETKRLEKENKKLRRELDDLVREVAEIKKCVRTKGALPGETPAPAQGKEGAAASSLTEGGSMEEILSRAINSMAIMVDAKMVALEDRLFPRERPMRPPLRADREREAANSQPTPGARPTGKPPGAARKVADGRPAAPPTKAAAGQSSGKKRKEDASKGRGKQAAAKRPVALPPRPLPPPPKNTTDESWVEVVKRGKGKKAASAAQQAPKSASNKSSAAPPKKSAPKGNPPSPPKKKKRPPKAPAVVLTLPPDGSVTMANVMAEARDKVKLSDIGLKKVRPRRAVTGGMILEVPGQDAAPKADELARRLTDVLADKGVRVSRPVKMAEIRVTGLDDSVQAEDLVAAIAGAGQCAEGDIKVGSFTQSPSGLFSVWARCPQRVADTLEEKRLLVGWVSARVIALKPRPFQCYRCLEAGHARQRCTNEVDRSGKCYRCGQEGHQARGCANEPKCPLCAEKGKPAGHRYGAAACLASKAAGRISRTDQPPREKGAAKKAAPHPSGSAQSAPAMETEGGLEEAMDTSK